MVARSLPILYRLRLRLRRTLAMKLGLALLVMSLCWRTMCPSLSLCHSYVALLETGYLRRCFPVRVLSHSSVSLYLNLPDGHLPFFPPGGTNHSMAPEKEPKLTPTPCMQKDDAPTPLVEHAPSSPRPTRTTQAAPPY